MHPLTSRQEAYSKRKKAVMPPSLIPLLQASVQKVPPQEQTYKVLMADLTAIMSSARISTLQPHQHGTATQVLIRLAMERTTSLAHSMGLDIPSQIFLLIETQQVL